MNLPKKIHPDNLVETIVEIRMHPLCPPELWAGMVSSRLLPVGYKFLPIPQINVSFSPEGRLDAKFQKSFPDCGGVFVKDNIRFMMQRNCLTFNCNLGKYVGWDLYSAEIEQVMKAVKASDITKVFNRTELRYISEYKDIPILDNIKGIIDVGEAGLGLNRQELKLSKIEENVKVFVSLTNLNKRKTPKGEYKSSLFDVNVYENFTESESISVVINSLNKAHQIEKETFFGLLKDDFVKSLNPEY